MIEFFPLGDDGLRVELLLSQPPARVFRAWANKTEFQMWFRGSEDGQLIVHDFDFREGGGFEVTMVSGSGHEATLVGTYLQVVPDHKLKFTWAWKSDEVLSPQMIVNIDFLPECTGTRIVILHEPFESLHDRDNHQSGWTPCLNNLIQFCATT